MNTKHRWIAAAGGCVLVAICALCVYWPREVAKLDEVAFEQRNVSQRERTSADFDRATVLTATEQSSVLPSSHVEHLPPHFELPSLDFQPTSSVLSDDAPISFMPERLLLTEQSQWQNGWDEPVADVGDELLAELPDLSTTAEWIAPTEPGSVLRETPAPIQETADTPTAPTTSIATTDDEASYIVQADDTLWTISQKVYGTGALFNALAEYNRSTVANPHSLEVGQKLATPAAELLTRQYPHLCPVREQKVADTTMPTAEDVRRPEYAVRAGDTLEKIAVIRLGRADRWREILALNHHVVGASGGYLKPGLILSLPDDARTAATVLRPTDSPR